MVGAERDLVSCQVTVMTDAPVRYSIEQPDFDHALGMRLRVFLDGVQISEVRSYDCETGQIERNATDENGRVLVDLDKGEFILETLHGSVTAELV